MGIINRLSRRWPAGIGATTAATSSATDAALRVPDVTWSSCPADQPGLTGFRCATIRVPLNYSDPGGATISLGLVEHPAATPGTPAPSPPLTPAQQATWANLNAQLNPHCTGQDEALLTHVSTADGARDLDLMRQALGLQKLDYYGISYGTLLGDTYANLFPGRVGKLVLDGNIDPQTWFTSGSQLSSFLRIGSDEATASTLKAFLSLCGKVTTAQCAFSAGTPAATEQKFSTLLNRAAKAPVVTGTGQAPISESDIVTLTDAELQTVSAEPAIGDPH